MLALEELIMESHDDFDIVSSLVVGFDESKNFIIELERTDYTRPERSFRHIASMNKEEAFSLSKALGVTLVRLPRTIAEATGRKSHFILPSQVESTFSDVLDFIVRHGGSYQLQKSRC